MTRIVADNNGKVTGVLYIRDGKEYFQPAKVVLVSSYTYENTRLLLLSKSKAYPNGLSNNHGQVGKHYFGHWDAQAGVNVTALFPMDVNTWYGAMLSQGVTVDEWADDTFDHSGLGFIGGASLCAFMEKHPIAAASMGTFGRAPAWGSKWKQFVHENANRFTGAYLQTNSFPYENTYLDLDPEVKDPLGDPVCRVTSGPKENETRAAVYAQNKMEEWFRAAGAIEVVKGQPFGPGVIHPHLRRNAHGRQSRDQRRGSLGIFARSAQPRDAGRLGVRHQRRAQSHAHHASAGVADGRASGEELESDCRLVRASTTLKKPSACRSSRAWSWPRLHREALRSSSIS